MCIDMLPASYEPNRSKTCLPPLCRSVARALLLGVLAAVSTGTGNALGAPLRAGVAKVEVTDTRSGPVSDPLYVRALVSKNEHTTAVVIAVDVVAIGQIGPIGNDYLGKVRSQLQRELGIPPTSVLVNASHCHGRVCADVAERTIRAVKQAASHLVPVHVGVGAGHEDRIMENRRLRLKNGRTVDVRHAYSLPPDDQVAAVGPVDPQIGILRLDRTDGQPLAVLYNFACHPIQGVPSGGNTADLTGFACRAIEDALGHGAVALFIQGCAGDINPVWYKDVDHPRDAEPLGNMLGLSTLKALRNISTREDDRLIVLHETIALPRADLAQPIAALEAKQEQLLGSLRGTTLNLKTFLHLTVKYGIAGDFPSYYSHRYLHDRAAGRNDLDRLDAENRRAMEQYARNVYIMEQLTRLRTNLALLRKHQAANQAAGMQPVEAELVGLRVGDFVLIAFPGELSVEIGLRIKKTSPHEFTFVAGYTNGYLYYTPTAEQLRNVGGAQEDSDCLVGPEWERIFEDHVAALLQRL